MHRPELLYTLSCALSLVFATACDPPDGESDMVDAETYPEDIADDPDEPDERPLPKPNHLKDLISAPTGADHSARTIGDAPAERSFDDLADATHSPTDPPAPDRPGDITDELDESDR